MSHADWEMVVGLEVHVQLKTRTKAFCGCSAAFGAAPNANTCPVCLALPGALPVLNAHAVELATRAALATECTVHERSVFARKNYFYPDLPKGYQISQFDQPIATHGRIVIEVGGVEKVVGITRIHMEEDAGKSVHDRFAGFTAIDLNRSGVPLVEIVSEPDIRSPAEAGAYLRKLRSILLYAEVSDCSMEEGSLRVDANVSARKVGETVLRTRTEIKNLNSFSAVEKALHIEWDRHVATWKANGTIEQQTMLWDQARGTVRRARSKEGSHDYRYFPEPDLPPLVLDRSAIDAARASLPELPDARRARFAAAYGLGAYDADVLTSTRELADYFEVAARDSGDAKHAANWVTGVVLATLKERGLDITAFAELLPASRMAGVIAMMKADAVSSSAAKTIFALMLEGPGDAQSLAEREGLLQVGDDAQLRRWVDEVWAEHPAEAARLAAGDRKLLGPLTGLVMKKSRGSADPRKVNQMLAERAGT
jgi:aspartyl-tRNA(Asn)/glutamyl-tRNA(Gln) amidotransferase subunit B